MSRVLYHERKEARASRPDGSGGRPVTDYVQVEVRHWGIDVVGHSMVMVNGVLEVDARQAFDGAAAKDACHIRTGIDVFDALLTAHPNKDELK